MKEKCIIFGTGSSAQRDYFKLSEDYEVIGFSDNNNKMWGKTLLNLHIIPPDEIKKQKAKVLVCSVFYKEIVEQLKQIGIENVMYFNPSTRMLDGYNDGLSRTHVRKILFVQKSACIRTYKISCILESNGIQVDLAFWHIHPKILFEDMKLPWKHIIPINDLNSFIHFVNYSDYDLIHYSNEPDTLMSLLLHSNKKIVYDNHDMCSMRGELEFADAIHEYISNRYSHGRIYVSKEVEEYANKFHIPEQNTFIMGNLIMESLKPDHYLEKLSNKDGELHCVYEGGVYEDSEGHRYYEEMFLKLAKNKIHVHFYSPWNWKGDYYKELERKSEYIHYEGKKNIKELIQEMTKYNVGLALINITERNKDFLDHASPNKLYEYLHAKLPVLVSGTKNFQAFIQTYKVGAIIDWHGDIKKQLETTSNIEIDDDFLFNIGATMDSYADKLIHFYENVINN